MVRDVMPVYQQLAAEIRERIARGMLTPGEQLESEVDLAKSLDVSRATVRQALAHLAQEGIIERIHGQGTFVSRHVTPLVHDLSVPFAFSGRWDGTDHELTPTILEFDVDPAPPDLVGARLASGSGELHRLVRAIRDGDDVVALHRAWVPDSVAPDLSARGLEHNSLTDTLLQRHGRLETIAEQDIEVVTGLRDELAILALPMGSPVIRMTRLHADEAGPFLFSQVTWATSRLRMHFVMHIARGAEGSVITLHPDHAGPAGDS